MHARMPPTTGACAPPAAAQTSPPTRPPAHPPCPRAYRPCAALPAPQVSVLVLCHTRELAYQICHEYERFTTYMKGARVGNFFGGLPIKQQREELKDKDKCPHIMVGTPGRVKGVRAHGHAARCCCCCCCCFPAVV